MKTIFVCDDGSSFLIKTGADADPGIGIRLPMPGALLTSEPRGNPLPKAVAEEITSAAFWGKLDAIRAAWRSLRDQR